MSRYGRLSKYMVPVAKKHVPAWEEAQSYSDCLKNYPMGSGKSPLTNNKRKRSASNAGGASVGGGT